MTKTAEKNELAARGYVPIEDHPLFKVGNRVRHIGDQYPEAIHKGTATILVVMEKNPSSYSATRRDIEMVVMSERHGEPQPSVWADYHAVPVEPNDFL